MAEKTTLPEKTTPPLTAITEMEKLKLEGFNLFMARENFQQNIAAVNQRLNEISQQLHQLTKEHGDGNPKKD